MLVDPLFDLTNKRIIVAGAASGLGFVIAKELALRGARLFLVDRDFAALQKVLEEVRGQPIINAIDATSETDVDGMVAEVRRAMEGIDCLVNSVGIYSSEPALDTDMESFRRMLDVNVTGALLLSRAAATLMGPVGGRIVHLASVSSVVANVNYVSYGTSKAALAHMVKLLAREWAPRRINVNAIGPAMTETNLSRGYMADPVFRERALNAIPLGRFGTPEDLLGMVVLLLSRAGAFITGQNIFVDGGRTLV